MFAKSSFVCESKICRQTGIARFLLWFTDAYIKNIFIKLIFKTFTFREFKKTGPNILSRSGIRTCSLCLLFRLAHLAKTVFSVWNKSHWWSNG